MQLATDGRVGLRSAIGSIWGPKGLEGIMDVDLELDVEVDKVMARREGLAITYVFL
jgi:DNA mismatch repair protein PMS2